MPPGARRVAGTTWLPALLAVLAVIEMTTLRPNAWGWAAALMVLACAALCARRRFPLASAMLALAAMVLMPVFGTPLDAPATPLAVIVLSFFTLGRGVPGRRALVGFAAVAVGIWADYRWFDDRAHDVSDVVFALVLAVAPFALGRLMRLLSAQKAALERNRDLVRSEAIRDERDRIARDLHDVIAHSVSAMVVQTAAAQDLVRTDPDRAEVILARVAEAGRDALTDTGRLLHVIRDTEGELGLGPAPGLAQVPALVDRFRSDGLLVDLELTAPLPVLPAGLDVFAYRIVQEALTNVLRYGADRTALLSIACAQDAVSIRTTNLTVGEQPSVGSGLGLLGMAERAAVLGGTVTHSVTAEGRFVLTARLPVPS